MKPITSIRFVLLSMFIAEVSAIASMAASLRVVCLNPVVADLAAQVAGKDIEVISLMPPGADPHAFRPTPMDYTAMREADVILAAGKGLERALQDIRDTVPNVELIEVSSVLPGLIVTAGGSEFAACPHHDHGHTDPHWWHSPKEVSRVVRFLGQVFNARSPESRDDVDENVRAFRSRLDDLDQWARERLIDIPADRRVLPTAHAAYNYFCRDYHFRAIPIRGLNAGQTATPQHLRAVIEDLRTHGIRTVFPEFNSNPSVLQALVREVDVTIAPPLLADTTDPENPGFENMFRHNVETIARALSSEGTTP